MLANAKITAFEAYLIMTLSVGVTNHVLLTPVLLQISGRDAWAGTMISIVPSLLLALLLGHIARHTRGMDVIGRIRSRFGRGASSFVGGTAVLYAAAMLLVTIEDTSHWAHVSYLPRTPVLAIAALFIVLCAFAAKAGIRSIAVCSGVLLPIVAALGLFVMTVNFKSKNYELLFPLFTQGAVPMLQSAAYSLSGTAELILLLFFQHYLRTPIRRSSLVWLTFGLVGLTFGPLLGAIALFGPFEAAQLRYPSFEQWRMVSLGKFVSHLDFLSIFQWLSGSFVRISMILFLITSILLGNSTRHRSATLTALAFGSVVFVAWPLSDIRFVNFLRTIYFPVSLLVSAVLVAALLCLVIFDKPEQPGGETVHE